MFFDVFIKFINFTNKNRDMGELFAEKILAGNRTYFFDVQYTVNENLYLTITEAEKTDKNPFVRNKIMIFEEDFQPFFHVLNKTEEYFK